MLYLIKKFVEMYKYIFYELGDPRTNDWFLLQGPCLLSIIAGFYLYFCTSFGQRFMEHRKPFELKRVVMLYNIIQVFFSIYIFNEGIHLLSNNFNFSCQPVDYSNSPIAMRAANGAWWYFFIKVTELFDTIFFILRKKYNQVSFLHVYHHTLMLIGMWVGAKYFPGGHPILMGTLNSFVHIVMYTYYLISSLGPAYQKYVWWKKYVTDLQLIQFVIIACHNIYPLFNDCAYPKILNLLLSINAILFIYLFGKFYIESYIKTKGNKKVQVSLKNNVTNNEENTIKLR